MLNFSQQITLHHLRQRAAQRLVMREIDGLFKEHADYLRQFFPQWRSEQGRVPKLPM
jgi:hypothetical protein